MRNLSLFFIVVLSVSCGSDPIPKPKALLRLDYPEPQYRFVENMLPFEFEINNLANNIDKIGTSSDNSTLGFEIAYPSFKGTIYITYKKIDKDKLQSHITDAQNITQTHAEKAIGISEQIFVNTEKRVFGSLFEVDGNAASQCQFYVTDSINHFLTGSLYFFARPNYDSILPASNYLKKDIQRIMESLEWKQ